MTEVFARAVAADEHATRRRSRIRRYLAVGVAALSTATMLAVTPNFEPHAVAAPAASGAKPNVLMIMTDDMRYDDLRFMPNVRRYIRDRGLDWHNSFATTPLCCPNRASYLTGKLTHNHRVWWHEAPWGYGAFDDSRTIGGDLQAAGYKTSYIGKYLNQYGIAAPRNAPGAYPATYVPPGWNEWRATPDNTPGIPLRDPRNGGTYRYNDQTINHNGRLEGHQGVYSSKVLINEAIKDFWSFNASGKPWYIQLNSLAPHHGTREKGDPYLPTPARPKWVRGKFNAQIPRGQGVPASGQPEVDVSDKATWIGQYMPNLNDRDRLALKKVSRQRAETLFVLDKNLGRLFGTLAASGQLNNTVLLFTSDNGYMIGEHRITSGKNYPYEVSYRLPLLMAGPGIPQGTRNAPITTIDVSATVRDWAGASQAGVDGHSMVADIAAPRGWNTATVFESHVEQVAKTDPGFAPDARTIMGVRTARYGYFRYADGFMELFDLLNDPNELSSVAYRPEYADIRAQLETLTQQTKGCAGADCTVTLPDDLQASEEFARHVADNQQAAKVAYYGQ
jgi:arylsulfatase A-like enzyme